MKLVKHTAGTFENDALSCPDYRGHWSDLGKLTRNINVVYKDRFVMWNANYGHLSTYPNFNLYLFHDTDDDGNIIRIGFGYSWTNLAEYGNTDREDKFAPAVSEALDNFFVHEGYADRTVKGVDACNDFITRLRKDVPIIDEYVSE